MKDFTNRVAAITGAGSGIGRELALELARRKCHVALCCDRNIEGLQETALEAEAQGVKATTQALDISDREAVLAWADQIVADHGGVNLIKSSSGIPTTSIAITSRNMPTTT